MRHFIDGRHCTTQPQAFRAKSMHANNLCSTKRWKGPARPCNFFFWRYANPAKGMFINYVCKFSVFLTHSPLPFAYGLHWQYPPWINRFATITPPLTSKNLWECLIFVICSPPYECRVEKAIRADLRWHLSPKIAAWENLCKKMFNTIFGKSKWTAWIWLCCCKRLQVSDPPSPGLP